jgi:hypothetical protein
MPQPVPRGVRNHNPGNIERQDGVKWQGMAADQSSDSRFVVFESAPWGIRALACTLCTYQDHRRAANGSRIDTVREIIQRWAPPVENHTTNYVNHVSRLIGRDPDAKIDVHDYPTMRALVTAIITHENGDNPYNKATLREGLALAGLKPGASDR